MDFSPAARVLEKTCSPTNFTSVPRRIRRWCSLAYSRSSLSHHPFPSWWRFSRAYVSWTVHVCRIILLLFYLQSQPHFFQQKKNFYKKKHAFSACMRVLAVSPKWRYMVSARRNTNRANFKILRRHEIARASVLFDLSSSITLFCLDSSVVTVYLTSIFFENIYFSIFNHSSSLQSWSNWLYFSALI